MGIIGAASALHAAYKNAPPLLVRLPATGYARGLC